MATPGYDEGTGIPTVGNYAAGFFRRNNGVPVLQGAPGALYVVFGWVRMTTGSNHVPGVDWRLVTSFPVQTG